MLHFSMRQTLGTLALLAGLGGLVPVSAHASTPLRGFMFGLPSSTMSKADWAAFHSAAGRLLNKMPSAVGQSEDWQGPSGAHGTLTIEKIFEQHNMPCRDVHAHFNSKKESRALNYNLDVCRDAQGEWRLNN